MVKRARITAIETGQTFVQNRKKTEKNERMKTEHTNCTRQNHRYIVEKPKNKSGDFWIACAEKLQHNKQQKQAETAKVEAKNKFLK